MTYTFENPDIYPKEKVPNDELYNLTAFITSRPLRQLLFQITILSYNSEANNSTATTLQNVYQNLAYLYMKLIGV